MTFARRAEMDFSLLTFATGATLLYPVDGVSSFEQLAGKKVGVLAGSTTETGLRKALTEAKIAAEVVAVPDHTDGMQRLASGEFAAYFGDGAILLYHLMQSPFRDRLRLSDKVLELRALRAGPAQGRRRVPAGGRPHPGPAVARRRDRAAVRGAISAPGPSPATWSRRCGSSTASPSSRPVAGARPCRRSPPGTSTRSTPGCPTCWSGWATARPDIALLQEIKCQSTRRSRPRPWASSATTSRPTARRATTASRS